MAVDVQVGKTDKVRRVEQFGGSGEADQDIGLGRSAPARLASFLGNGVIERRHPATGFLEPRS